MSQGARRKTALALLDTFADNLKEMQNFSRKISVILFFGLLAIPVSAFGQVDTAWVRYYNGSADGMDEAQAIAVDDSGNVYVTGGSNGSAPKGGYDYATIKYDRNGNQLWVRGFNGSANGSDYAWELALDRKSNVYVTGESQNLATYFDYATVKYDSQGNQQWVAFYNDPLNGGDAARRIAVDDSGNVYVTGISESTGVRTQFCGIDYDLVTLKYDPNGNRVWSARYFGQGNSAERVIGLAIDLAGNTYLAGQSCDPNTEESGFLIIKSDLNGHQLWARHFGDSANFIGSAVSIKVDSIGNVFVTGYSYNNVSKEDYITIKYDVQGNLLWMSRYNGPGYDDDRPASMRLDGKGSVYITGYSWTGTSLDIATIKYDSNGNELWIRRYNGPANGADKGTDIVLDADGNVYVAGVSLGNGSVNDYVILKYDSSGSLIWQKRYGGPLDYSNYHVDPKISVDQNGNVYLTGSCLQHQLDYVTIKYSPLPSLKGDLNLDGVLTLADVVLMLNFTFRGDPFPAAPTAGDFNCDSVISAADAVILLQIFFASTPAPC